MSKKYDFIIAGMGCAGLSLAHRIAHSPILKDAKVLLIDRDLKQDNDRTWSYWESGDGYFEDVVCKNGINFILKALHSKRSRPLLRTNIK